MKIYRHAIVAGLLSLLLVFSACTDGGSNGSGNDTAAGSSGGTSGGAGGTSGSGTAGGGTGGTLEAVPFHGNQEQIKREMAKIPGAAPDMTVSNEYGSTLNWTGGRFEGIPVDQWGFSFYRGQMLYASLHFTTATSGLDADRLYDTLTAVVTGRHGGMIMDSKNLASRALIGYSEADQNFISDVGSSLAGMEFRMWTSGDSSAAYIATVHRAPRKDETTIKDVYLTWYDRMQYQDYKRMIDSYSK